MREAVIIEAVRTPVGKRGGVLSQWHPVDLLGHTLRHLVERAGVDPVLIDDVIAGCAMQHDQQAGNIARHAVLSAGFPESVPGVTIDRQCGSAQQAVSFAAYGVMAGGYDLAIACGVESMSQVALPAALNPGAPLGPYFGPLELERYDGGLMVQGPSSELMNQRFGLSREALDAFSIRSHQRAHRATVEGRFRRQLVPITSNPHDARTARIEADEGIRANVDPARMANLPTPFSDNGRTTAGNASQLSDGAAALLIADREFAERHGLRPRAKFRALSVAAADPVIQFRLCGGGRGRQRVHRPLSRRTARRTSGPVTQSTGGCFTSASASAPRPRS